MIKDKSRFLTQVEVSIRFKKIFRSSQQLLFPRALESSAHLSGLPTQYSSLDGLLSTRQRSRVVFYCNHQLSLKKYRDDGVEKVVRNMFKEKTSEKEMKMYLGRRQICD